MFCGTSCGLLGSARLYLPMQAGGHIHASRFQANGEEMCNAAAENVGYARIFSLNKLAYFKSLI